jgi:hypothetical protein
MFFIRRAAACGALLIVSAGPSVLSEPPEAVTLDPARVVWSELDFKMHKLVINPISLQDINPGRTELCSSLPLSSCFSSVAPNKRF